MSIKTSITRSFGRQSLRLKQNTPHILFGAGLVGIVGSTVLACRATLKLEITLDQVHEEMQGLEDPTPSTYIQNAAKVGALYAPAAAVGLVSIGLLTGSHIQMTRRNAAITAAYTGLHTAYNEYRSRVREHVGDDVERDLYLGVKTESVEGEDGKKKKIKTVDVNKMSPYARFFDEGSVNWQKDGELNRLFVQCQQNYANQILQSRGHIFLNEVYDMLGIDRSQAGQVVGWVINDQGDNFVDFGMFEPHNSAFISGYERSILLDFNVDGVIYDKI